MSVIYTLFYLVRWLIFLIRWVLALAYGLVTFFSKPGSRFILPVLAAAVTYAFLPMLHAKLHPVLLPYNIGDPLESWVADGILALGLVVATAAYVIASRILAVVLGAFPPIIRPLPPMRRLRVKARVIVPAVVRLVVPPLPRRPRRA
jgi:hypothetical protein